MPEREKLFLTLDEARDAIARDFSQYPDQLKLLASLVPLVLGDDAYLIQEHGNRRVWLKSSSLKKPVPLTADHLGKFILQQLDRQLPSPERMARICTRVFQTFVTPSSSRNDGFSPALDSNRDGRFCLPSVWSLLPETGVQGRMHRGRLPTLGRIGAHRYPRLGGDGQAGRGGYGLPYLDGAGDQPVRGDLPLAETRRQSKPVCLHDPRRSTHHLPAVSRHPQARPHDRMPGRLKNRPDGMPACLERESCNEPNAAFPAIQLHP
jgi:hypothetical protein